MNVNVQISLGPDDENPTMTPEEMLTALGGDITKDSIGVRVSGGYSPPPIAPAPAGAAAEVP